jgi:hypothetical protein
MKHFILVFATTALVAIGLQLPANANKRPYPVEPMSAKDLRQVPAGAAIWFHKKGKIWFHIVIDGHGYMKIDRSLYKFFRKQPTGDTWGCMPMVFEVPDGGTRVRIRKEAGGWTIKVRNGTQTDEFKGLTCASGD